MFERLSSKQKMWLGATFVMLALPVFLPSSPDFDLVGICTAILVIASYPLNMLFLPIYYLLDYYLQVQRTPIGNLYFFMVSCSLIGYLQWFVVFPFLLRKFREKVIAPDFQTLFGQNPFNILQLPHAERDVYRNWFDKENRTPFERVMRKDEKE